jgi:hypothetical protein
MHGNTKLKFSYNKSPYQSAVNWIKRFFVPWHKDCRRVWSLSTISCPTRLGNQFTALKPTNAQCCTFDIYIIISRWVLVECREMGHRKSTEWTLVKFGNVHTAPRSVWPLHLEKWKIYVKMGCPSNVRLTLLQRLRFKHFSALNILRVALNMPERTL